MENKIFQKNELFFCVAVFLNIPRTGAGRGGLGGLAPPGVEKIFLKKSSKSAKNRIGLSKKSLFFNFFSLQNRYFSSISVKSRPCYSMSVILTDIVFFHSSNYNITLSSNLARPCFYCLSRRYRSY